MLKALTLTGNLFPNEIQHGAGSPSWTTTHLQRTTKVTMLNAVIKRSNKLWPSQHLCGYMIVIQALGNQFAIIMAAVFHNHVMAFSTFTARFWLAKSMGKLTGGHKWQFCDRGMLRSHEVHLTIAPGSVTVVGVNQCNHVTLSFIMSLSDGGSQSQLPFLNKD